MKSILLTRVQASAYLKQVWGISRTPKTLATFAATGRGPDFIRIRRPGAPTRYTPKNLDAWVRSMVPKKRPWKGVQPTVRTS